MLLDKFYTKPEIAQMCVDISLPFIGGRVVVEPSAGNGSFFDILPKGSLGYDIAPECKGVEIKDYLEVEIPEGCMVIGNPPFGNRCGLAKEFIKNSLKAHIVAFILPSTFRKETMQKVFPEDWNLIMDVELPLNSFTKDGEDFNIPCVFQVWSRAHDFFNLRESIKVKQTTEDFEFTNKRDANWFIFGAAPHNIIHPKEVNENNRGYYIRCSRQVKSVLEKIKWGDNGLSGVSGGVAWFTKQNIINIYLKEVKNGN